MHEKKEENGKLKKEEHNNGKKEGKKVKEGINGAGQHKKKRGRRREN